MRHLAIIPARSGSKGLPDKNIKLLCGKPLLQYSVEAATEAGVFDMIHLSTDSAQYAEIGRAAGADVPFLRSQAASSDTATTWQAVLEVLDKYEQLGCCFDTVTILQPTTPLRTAEDIRSAFRLMEEKTAETVVSVCECEHSPLWSNTLANDLCMNGFLSQQSAKRRQEQKTFYRLNGAIYLLKTKSLRDKGSVVYDEHCFASVMKADHSVDIDTQLDFVIAEAIFRTFQQKQ